MKRFVWRISILVLAFTSLLSYSSMARSQSEITLQSPEEHGRLSYDYDTMFAFVRKFLTGDRGKRVQNKLLKKVFAEELLISEELQQRYGFPDRLKEMSVQQFMILLQHNPDYWPRLAELLTLFPDKTDDTEEAKARSKAAMKELHKMIEDSGIKEWFAKVNKPTEPFELRLPRNKAGYSNLQFFATHERKYLDGTTKPADNMIEVL